MNSKNIKTFNSLPNLLLKESLSDFEAKLTVIRVNTGMYEARLQSKHIEEIMKSQGITGVLKFKIHPSFFVENKLKNNVLKFNNASNLLIINRLIGSNKLQIIN